MPEFPTTYNCYMGSIFHSRDFIILDKPPTYVSTKTTDTHSLFRVYGFDKFEH